MTLLRALTGAVVGMLVLTAAAALATLSRAAHVVEVQPLEPIVAAAAELPLPDPSLDPVPAPAPERVVPPAFEPPADVAHAALGLIDYPIDRLGYSIEFAGERKGLLGLTTTTTKSITIYVRPTQTPREIAKVIAHELGHAIDVEATTPAERVAYRQIRGIGSRPWYPDCSGCTDYSSPAGDFAETFAQWLLGDIPFSSTIAPRPTAEQLAALSAIFTL